LGDTNTELTGIELESV